MYEFLYSLIFRLHFWRKVIMREAFRLNSKFALKHNDNGDVQLEGFAIHGGENFIVNGFYEVPESERGEPSF